MKLMRVPWLSLGVEQRTGPRVLLPGRRPGGQCSPRPWSEVWSATDAGRGEAIAEG
jgi:hypothetical protein